MKALLTTGCSFSHPMPPHVITWNMILENMYKTEYTKNTGTNSTGNELIARKSIKMVTDALDKYNAEDIVLIVMWSTVDRKSFLTDRSNILNPEYVRKDVYGDYAGANVVQGSTLDTEPVIQPGWVWANSHWKDPCVETWYEDFDNEHAQLERTLWDMLAVQSYCEARNVKYYWMYILDDIFLNDLYKERRHYCDYLLKNLNKNNLIVDRGITNWIKTYPNSEEMLEDDTFHPNNKGHQFIVDKLIYPFLQNENILI